MPLCGPPSRPAPKLTSLQHPLCALQWNENRRRDAKFAAEGRVLGEHDGEEEGMRDLTGAFCSLPPFPRTAATTADLPPCRPACALAENENEYFRYVL